MTRYAMVIDLQRCAGCGACIITCKNENNLTDGVTWSNKITKTSGTFPNVRYDYIPTLCNHCERAPCVKTCPTRAMHKIEGDITMHDADKCIGCKSCMAACPYGVIYFNWESPHKQWKSNAVTIEGGTSSPAEVVSESGGDTIPYYNKDRADTLPGIRPKGIVEKCTLCDHRIKKGMLPYCVDGCPANARIIGDLDDPDSEVNYLLSKYAPTRLRENMGTEPKVFYIRDFNPASYSKTKGGL